MRLEDTGFPVCRSGAAERLCVTPAPSWRTRTEDLEMPHQYSRRGGLVACTALLAVVGLAACGNSEPTTKTAGEKPTATEAPETTEARETTEAPEPTEAPAPPTTADLDKYLKEIDVAEDGPVERDPSDPYLQNQVQDEATGEMQAPATTEAPAPPPPPTEPPAPAETVSQANARRKAESYLDFMAFSASGLIEQLEYEGFTTEDASYAVFVIDVDWNEQAAKKAASYLDFMGFSHSGLVEQLIFEGFTPEQAEYGVSTTGL